MPNLHAQIKHHQQWQLPLVCPSPLWRKERDSSERLRELVSPDCALGHGEIGAHLCHRQWGSSLCVTLLRHCWYQLVRARSYTHRALLLWQRLVGRSRKAGHFLPHPQRPRIQSALTATRQDIFSVKLPRKITRILILKPEVPKQTMYF